MTAFALVAFGSNFGPRRAQCLGGFEIDDRFELVHPQDGQFGWILSLENPADIETSMAVPLAAYQFRLNTRSSAGGGTVFDAGREDG
jgi:hypothetical protein